MPKPKKAKKAIPASEFKDLPIWKELKGKKFKFKPFVFYNPDGDSIQVVWENGSFYRKWINHELTLYLSDKDGHAVGCLVEGVKGLRAKGIKICGGKA